MTAIRQEAIQMLEKVPEDKRSFVMQIMQGVNGLIGVTDTMEAMGKFFTKCMKEHIQIVTSALTIEEYLVSPYSNGKMEYVDNFKAMDALQIATAENVICSLPMIIN